MHLQRPLISIVIPTINRATWLGQALQSAVAQTRHPGIEVVVVDNGSTDNTWEVIQAHSNTAVRVIKNVKTLNICDNWQVGLEATRGDYVLFLGDDDCLFPQWGQVLTRTLKQQQEVGKQPSYIAWNHINFIATHPLSNLCNLIMYPRTLTGQIKTLNGKSLRNAYLRQPSEQPFPVYPHPSLLLFHRKQIDEVCLRFNTRWFDGLYPDYHAGVLAGSFTSEALFLDQALVCIGGVEKRYYCRKQSKMERFNQGGEAPNMPVLADGIGSHSPYFALNAAQQMVYSCSIINHPLDEQKLLEKLIPETVENIWFCECIFGKGSHSNDFHLLARRFGQDTIKKLIRAAQRKIWRDRLNRLSIAWFGQGINIALRSLLKKRIGIAAPKTVYNLLSAVAWHNQHHPNITTAIKS